MLAQLACIFYWPNPLVWLGARAMRAAQEEAADDVVLSAGLPADAYAAQLFDAARSVAAHGLMTNQVVAMAQPSTLESRLLSIVNESRSRQPVSRGTAIFGATAAALMLAISSVTQLGAEQKPNASPGSPKPSVDGEPPGITRPRNTVIFGNPALDDVTLIGLPKEEALKRLGEPDQILGPEEGYQTYDYGDRHLLSVVFHKGKLVQYMLDRESKCKTTKGIAMGSPLALVTSKYGDIVGEESVSRWFGGKKQNVLYHHPEYDKYKINYAEHDLIFMFDEDKKVESIWVGYIFPKE